MREVIGAGDPRSWAMRFHTQTAGSTLTAQQPLTNVVRTTVQAMSAVMGGAQSLHTNSYDEALGLPTEQSATLALRTQQILAFESGLTSTVDPWGGSYFMEALTDEIEKEAVSLIDRVEEMGGAVRAIELGFMQAQIEDAAYREARRQASGQSVVVGVNRFVEEAEARVPVLKVDPALERDQILRLREWRAQREASRVAAALEAVGATAGTDENLLPVMKRALAAGATVGEVSDALRVVFGVYRG
jgi:methylmalonyl-CoA mutase N-terminal domain/subunit